MKKSLLCIMACLMFLQTGLVLAMEEAAKPTPDELGKNVFDLISTNLNEAILEKVKSLIGDGANVNAHFGFNRDTALMIAAGNTFYAMNKVSEESQTALAKMLIAAGADVNAENKHKDTPLVFAIQSSRYPQIITNLIEAGATIRAPYNREMKNPLDLAVGNALKGGDHEKAILKAMVTTLSPIEVQHILPMVMALKLRIPETIGKNIPLDMQRLLRNTFVEQVVNEKLAFAKQFLPNVPEAELRTAIEQSLLRVLRKPTVVK